MHTPPPVNHIIETVIYSADLEADAEFYGTVLGLREFERSDHHLFFAVGHTVLLIFDPARTETQTQLPAHGGPPNGHFAIQIDAEYFEAWRDYLTGRNIAIEKEHHWPDGKSRSLYFRDPSGNSVELVTRPMWEKYLQ